MAGWVLAILLMVVSGAAPLAAQELPQAPPQQTQPSPPAEAAPPTQETQPPGEAPPAAPPPVVEEPASEAPVPNGAVMPHDLSPWGMYMQADIVVKAVMIGLVLASFLTWTVWVAKGLELAGAKRKARSATRKIVRADSLADAVRAVGAGWTRKGPVADLVGAAVQELKRSADTVTEGTKERVAIALSRIEARAGRGMTRGTGLLATVGSTAPFVGLFGTVWGIMNSFIGIAESNTTNLAVVAPGIAEALLATALGLVAAIPAVIMYNGFARSIAHYRALLSDATGEIMQHLSRDRDLADLAAAHAEPSPPPEPAEPADRPQRRAEPSLRATR